MKVTHFSYGKTKYANIYLLNSEKQEDHQELINHLKKDHKVSIIYDGTQSPIEFIHHALTDYCSVV